MDVLTLVNEACKLHQDGCEQCRRWFANPDIADDQRCPTGLALMRAFLAVSEQR